MGNDHSTGKAGPNDSETTARQQLAVNLRVLRMLRGWSQEVLADLAQVDRSYVGGIERGERSAGLDCVERLARAFDLQICDLLLPMDTDEIGRRIVANMRSKASG